MEFSTLSTEEKKLFYGEPIFEFNSTPPVESQTQTFNLRPLDIIHQQTAVIGGAVQSKRTTTFLQKLIIRQNNRYKSIWDVLIMLFVIYSSFSTAYIIAFDIGPDEMSTSLGAFEYFVDACFYLDLIFNFFQEYRDPKSFECISDLLLIAKNYLKTWFTIDLLAILPFQLLGYDRYFQLLRILRLPRLLRYLDYSRIDRLLHSMLENSSSKKRTNYMYACRYVYKVLRLILVATILAYFLGCLWYWIITNVPGDAFSSNFFDNYGLVNYTRFRRLIICCYFMLTTLTTVGYGDFAPLTEVEKTLSIVIMILGISLFSYIIGNFNDLLTTYDKQVGITDYSTELHRWLKSLCRFTQNQPLPSDLVDKINEHFKFFWRNDRLSNLSYDDNYLQKMPKSLQYRLIQYMFDDVFALFRGFFHVNTFRESPFYYELAFSFLPCRFEAGEFILKPGQLVEEVYLIKEGSVYIHLEYEGKTIGKVFSKGYFFGANNVFRNHPAQFYYKAIKGIEPCTKVIAIPKSKLLKLLHEYPPILAAMVQSAKTNDNSLRNMIKTELKLMLRKLELPCKPEDIDAVYDKCVPNLKKNTTYIEKEKTTTVSAQKLEELNKALAGREQIINQKLNQIKKFGEQLGDDMEDILFQLRRVKESIAKTEKKSVMISSTK